MKPEVAVCIPAAGDRGPLIQTISSIRCAAGGDDALVIVAVDGHDAILEATARRHADTVVVLERNSGSYAARNAAVEALPTEISYVLFTDSGLQVDQAWLESHLLALVQAPRSGGPVLCTIDDPPSAVQWVDQSRHFNQKFNVEQLHYSVTANLGVRREVLSRFQFDPRLRSGGDFEFGQRAERGGYPIIWTERAVVRHPARQTLRSLLEKVDRVGKGAALLARLGYESRRRRDANRLTALTRARVAGYRDRGWLAKVALIELACRVIYARRARAFRIKSCVTMARKSLMRLLGVALL